MSGNIFVSSPVAPEGVATQSLHALDVLRGKAIGFIDNGKPNFDHLVDDKSAR